MREREKEWGGWDASVRMRETEQMGELFAVIELPHVLLHLSLRQEECFLFETRSCRFGGRVTSPIVLFIQRLNTARVTESPITIEYA